MLRAVDQPWLTALTWTAFACYGAAFVATLAAPPSGKVLVRAGVAVHVAVTVWRGWIIGFVPFTSKSESFLGAALGMALVTALSWRPARLYVGSMLALTLAPFAAALSAGLDLRYPAPLLYTVWYPLHVPLSFVAFSLWTASGMAGLQWFRSGRERAWLDACDQRSLQAFGVWTVAMIFGGIWGVVAWGAAFLWDPKMLWSVILWFHGAGFVHLHLTPAFATKPWTRPVAALVGFFFILVAYVGTSFFFGKGSHAF